MQNGCAYIQAGGGIVADSNPTAEYQESMNKARALLHALDQAESIASERRKSLASSAGSEDAESGAILRCAQDDRRDGGSHAIVNR
jgi:anthranilate synthase component 1